MANTAYYSTDYTPTFRNNNGFISYSYVSTVPTTMNDFEENCCGGETSYKMLFQLQYVPIVEKVPVPTTKPGNVRNKRLVHDVTNNIVPIT